MNELAIKTAFLTYLHNDGTLPKGTLIANEFAVDRHSRRADLAFFGDRFVGVEVKSSLDSLARLEGQIDTYQRFFDEVHAVVAEKHTANAMALLPANVAVWSVEPGQIRCHRKPSEPAQLQVMDLCQILHANELRRLTALADTSRLSRQALVCAAAELPYHTIRAAVFRSLEKRFRCSTDEFWNGVHESTIMESDLVRLSRFGAKRKAQAMSAAAASSFWDEWRIKAQYAFSS